MIKKLLRLLTPRLESQVREELFIAQRELLEAEGALETCTARVAMLHTRVMRLTVLNEKAELRKEAQARVQVDKWIEQGRQEAAS
jgi:hypothetical protein